MTLQQELDLPKPKINTLWLKDLKSKEDKDNFLKYLLNSTILIDKVQSMLDQKIRSLESQTVHEDFETPAWPYKRAHLDGRIRELRDLKELFTFERTRN